MTPITIDTNMKRCTQVYIITLIKIFIKQKINTWNKRPFYSRVCLSHDQLSRIPGGVNKNRNTFISTRNYTNIQWGNNSSLMVVLEVQGQEHVGLVSWQWWTCTNYNVLVLLIYYFTVRRCSSWDGSSSWI